MRLGGWQRLGVVLSAVWAIGAFIRIRAMQVKAADELFQMKSARCIEQPGAQLSKCFEQYSLQDAMNDTASWPDVAFFAIAPPVAAWLIVLLTIQAIRWTKSGFRKNEA